MQLPQDASRLWRFLYGLVTLIKPLFCRLRVEGAHHIPAAGGCVLACNHTRGPDYILLAYASTRQVYFMAKTEIFAWHPMITRILAAAGAFPIRRGQGDVDAIHTAIAVVQGGKVLGMFPEGTRSRSGQLGRGKSGVARIAMSANAPVIPAVVINAPLIFPHLLSLRRRPEVIVRFGPPVWIQGNPDNLTEARQKTEQIMHAIAALLPEARRGRYGNTATPANPERPATVAPTCSNS